MVTALDGELAFLGLDEAQFLPFEDLLPFVLWLIDEYPKAELVLLGLDSTWDDKPWPWLGLLGYASDVVKLKAVCQGCGADAIYNYRRGSSKEQVLVGAEDEYMALCRPCKLARQQNRTTTPPGEYRLPTRDELPPTWEEVDADPFSVREKVCFTPSTAIGGWASSLDELAELVDKAPSSSVMDNVD